MICFMVFLCPLFPRQIHQAGGREGFEAEKASSLVTTYRRFDGDSMDSCGLVCVFVLETSVIYVKQLPRKEPACEDFTFAPRSFSHGGHMTIEAVGAR